MQRELNVATTLDAERAALEQLVAAGREAAAGAAQRVRRTHDEREANAVGERDSLVDGVHGERFGHGLADADQQLLEGLAILRLLDRGQRRAEKTHAVSLQHAGLRERDREIQSGLPAQRGKQTVRALLRDDALEHFDCERLDVRHVRDARVGHDRRGIRVHEHGLDAFFPKRATRLRSRVIELRGLPDRDRPRADDEDLHPRRATASRTSAMKRSNTPSLSRGPGAPSGWYW